MSKDTFYSAVDIGSSKIYSVVARIGTEGELKVLGTGLVPSQGVQKGRVENIEEVRAAVSASLEEAQRYVGRGIISGAYVSVNGTHISCLNTKNMVENPNDIDGDLADGLDPALVDKLIELTAPEVDPSQEIIHLIPMGYLVDGLALVRNPSGLHAKEVEVESHVVLGDSAVLRNTLKVLDSNRVGVGSLVQSSLAAAEATLTGDEREMGAVLVDIGGGTTGIMIYRQGTPWHSSMIPVGGNQLTRDLAVAMRVPFYVAEEIKVKAGAAMPEWVQVSEEVVVPGFEGQPRRVVKRRDLSEPLHDRVMEILKMVLLRVRESGLRHIPSGGLVFTGGGAQLDGLCKLAQETFGVPARLAYPSGIAGLPSELQKPSASVVVGLLLWGIKHYGQKRTYNNVRNADRSRHMEKTRNGKKGGGFRSLISGRKKEEQKKPEEVTVE